MCRDLCARAPYQESEVEAGDDGGGDGEGGELEVAEVADEGLRDDVDREQRDPLEDGRRHDAPQLLRLHRPLRRRQPRAPRLGVGGPRRLAARLRLQQRRRPRRLLLHGAARDAYLLPRTTREPAGRAAGSLQATLVLAAPGLWLR